MQQKLVLLLDPFAGSANLGDGIIKDSIVDEIEKASESRARIVSVSVHQRVSRSQRNLLARADTIIAGGSNLLNFRYIPFRDDRWKMSLFDFFLFRDIVLFGVGWSSYDVRSNFLGSTLYKRVISKSHIHSVRDDYTKRRMSSFGIPNSVNTACPTMWPLTPEHLSHLRKGRSNAVVFTLTDYCQDVMSDSLMVSELLKIYKDVYFWPQGARDYNYYSSFAFDDVKVLPPSVAAFDNILSHADIDYVGTRLHAGIRALQKGRRALIVSIDNRALEISRDTNLPTIERRTLSSLGDFVARDIDYDLTLPWENIEMWRDQLRTLVF